VKAKKRTVAKGRMTPAAIAAVLAEIKAYGRGERERPLTWLGIVEFAGFSHVALWKKEAIKFAFRDVQRTQRADATPAIRAPRTTDERIVALESTIRELRLVVQNYDEQWALYEYNAHRLGIEPEELRRPLDPIGRHAVRSRRTRIPR